jgi:predicted metalloprotease with PDZ domain
MLVTGLAFADGEGRAFFGDGEGRGYLGVSITTVDHSDAEDTQEGVYISSISHGSGAEAAGLKEHDRIVLINGYRVEDMGDLDTQMERSRPGDVVDLVVLRDGREEGFQVTLGEHSARTKFEFERGKFLVELKEPRARLGVHSQTLSPQLAEFFEVDHGVLVTDIAEGSAAQAAGLRAGDIILEVGGHTIADNTDIFAALDGRNPGQTIEVTLQSRGRLEVLALTLDEAMDKQKLAAFNVMLSGVGNSASKTLQLEVPGSATFEFRKSEDSADAIRLKIHKLEQELERLQEQLERQGND